MIDRDERLPVTSQCELLDVARSTVYYQPKPTPAGDIDLMRRIDEIHLTHPFLGSRRIVDALAEAGFVVNRKKVVRLMRIMGLAALYPKRRTTIPAVGHRIYPYLLRGLKIDRPNQVWCADVTYLPMAHGFMYLVAVMDWYSRKVLCWRLSNTMDTSFCIDVLTAAIEAYGAPEMFNTEPRLAIHQRGIHWRAQPPRHHHQHGWSGPVDGQRIHRTALAQRQIRGGLPQGI
jgi:putative transposase